MPRAARSRTNPRALRAILTVFLLLPAVVFPPRSARSVNLPPPILTSRLSAVAAPRGARAPSTRDRLPDSVLALVEAGKPDEPGRVIGRSRFIRAWVQALPPARPDSSTPAGARQFLDLLLDQEALGLMAARERWIWTAPESAAFAILRDQLVVGAVLDSALAEARASLGAGRDTVDRQTLGLLARDRAMAAIRPACDDSLLARLARAFAALERPTPDSSLAAQLRLLSANPRIDPADTGRVVARSAVAEYRVADLLAAWARLSPAYRPRIESAEQVRELVMNGLFERCLRLAGSERILERRPELAARLAERRERIGIAHLVAREVYAKIAADSLTLLRYYRSTEREWLLPTRVRLVRLVLPSAAAAEAMALRLVSAAEAESLAAGARRQGVEWSIDLSAAEDSALFTRALGAGTGSVLGPDPTPDGWAVARVVVVLPARERAFAEVREAVSERWRDEEARRLLRALVSRARAGLHIAVNERSLEALVRDPPAELRARPR
jgi:hypothetical protein